MFTKPRVALIALHFAEYSAHLAMALANDIEVLLVLYRNNVSDQLGSDWQKWLRAPSLRVHVLDRPNSVTSIFRNVVSLISALQAFRPSVIHLQEDIRDELFLSLLFFWRLPVVLTIHDPVTHSGRDSLRLRFSRLRLYRYVARRMAKAAIAHGKLLALAVEEVCPWLIGKVTAIAHGPLCVTDIRQSAPSSANTRLLFFGRIHKYKGLANFEEAVNSLRQEGLPVVGVVAGKGSDLDDHRQSMLASGGFEILDRYIPASEVPILFDQCRVIVLPYTDGTQSGVAAIALGRGLPVVATAVGSIPELVRHGVNGLLVPAADPTALKDAIRRLILDDALWEQLANGSKLLRDGALSWKTIAIQTHDFYISMLPRTLP